MNSERHYLVVKAVASCGDRHYNLPQFLLPGSDVHYSFFLQCICIDAHKIVVIEFDFCPDIAILLKAANQLRS